jgi:hypothetical protein
MKEKAGFSKEYDDNPALKGGQKNLPDGLQKAIINEDHIISANSCNDFQDLEDARFVGLDGQRQRTTHDQSRTIPYWKIRYGALSNGRRV